MRLDKFIAENTGLTRSQATKVIRQSAVKINGEIVKNGATKVSQEDKIYFEDELLTWVEEGQYFMLHKPQGYVCSHDDGDYPTIYQFFEPPLSGKLHSAGRLDVDTTGLVLLTDDGQWSHRITSPKHQCEKTYLVTLADPVENHYASACEEGILLRGEKEPTKPAKLDVLDDYNVNLTISEGRYHQVKRMFAALGNKVVALHRWRIGNVELDESLEEGQYFMLHKPQGYVCSHDDDDYPTIYQFFEPPLSSKLHSAGRLDVDTTGLVLLTDDGQWSHRITSPKHQCEKTYLVTLADPVENHYASACEEGILLRGEKEPTKPAKLEVLDDYNVNLTISEGRYHQVKRMFAALGNKVVGLHRWRIGNVELDESLEEGEFRPLTQEEIDNLVK